MKLLCPACLESVEAPDALMAEPGAKMRCPSCRADFLVRPGGAERAPSRPAPASRFPLPGRDSSGSLPAVLPPVPRAAAPLPPRPPQRSSTSIPAFKSSPGPTPTPAGGVAPPFSNLLHDLQESDQNRRSSTSLKAFPPRPAVPSTPPAASPPATPQAPAGQLRADAAVAFGWDRAGQPAVPAQPEAVTRFSAAASTDSRHESLAPDDAELERPTELENDEGMLVASIAEASLPPVTVALTALAMMICLVGGWLLWVAYQHDGLLDLRRLDRAMAVVEQVAQPPSLRAQHETLAPAGALTSLEVTAVRQSIYPTAGGTELVVVEGFVVNRSPDTTFRRIYLRVTATSLRDEVFIDRLIPAGALLEQPGLEAIRDGATLAQTYDTLERRAAGLQVAPGQRTPFSAVAIVPKGGDLTDATIKATILDAEQLVPEACWRPASGPEGSGQ